MKSKQYKTYFDECVEKKHNREVIKLFSTDWSTVHNLILTRAPLITSLPQKRISGKSAQPSANLLCTCVLSPGLLLLTSVDFIEMNDPGVLYKDRPFHIGEK